MTRQRIRPVTSTISAWIHPASLAPAGSRDDSVAAGDFLTPGVAPADFSPYGYDYSMYDILTGKS